VKVVDASVLVRYLTHGDHREIVEAAVGPEHWLWVPTLIDAEVGNALRGPVAEAADQLAHGATGVPRVS
jgi:predicted nucleic acid-binding protein